MKQEALNDVSGIMQYVNESDRIDRDFLMKELQKVYDKINK